VSMGIPEGLGVVRPREIIATCDRCKLEGRSDFYPRGSNIAAPEGWGGIGWSRKGRTQKYPYVTSDTLRIAGNEGHAHDANGETYLCAACLNEALIILGDFLGSTATALRDEEETRKAFAERDKFEGLWKQVVDLVNAIRGKPSAHWGTCVRSVENELDRLEVLVGTLCPEEKTP
jgi:hypothetical protein